MKINKNTPCPCGSGKIFKKCCANIKKEDRVFNDEFVNFIKNNNSIEILEFISYLQLIPENSSKIIRLEEIQHLIIDNLHSNFQEKKIDYKILKEIIIKKFPYDRNEDPSESCFSENLMFKNGNNIVFPGIAHDSTDINQLMINSIFLSSNEISDKCKLEIDEGITLILFLFKKITRKIKRYEFIDDYRGNITFPKKINESDFKNLFTFTKGELQRLITKLKLEYNCINDISIYYKDVNRLNINESNLLKKPFIVLNDEKYYLALPSSQMYCLNIFINDKLKENNNEYEFKKSFFRMSKYEGDLIFKKMGWRIASEYQSKIDFDIEIWSFDSNKFAIVYYILQTENDKSLFDKISTFVNSIKGNEESFILIGVSSYFNLEFQYHSIRQPDLSEFKYQMIIGLYDLKRLIVNWNLNKRDLWKYLKAEKRANDKGLNLFPAFSILTYFSYYKQNENSFFHSDDPTPNYLHFSYDIQGNKVIESLQKEDKHLVAFIDESGVPGYLPVTKYDILQYAPIYLADTYINGEIKVVLTKYTIPFWITGEKSFDLEAKNFIDAIAYWLHEFYETLNLFLEDLQSVPINIEVSLEEGFYNYTTVDLKNNSKETVQINYTINQICNKLTIIVPSNIHNMLKRNDNYGEQCIMETVLKGILELLRLNYNYNLEEVIIENIINNHMPLNMAKMIIAGNTIEDLKLEKRFLLNKVERLNKADSSIVLEDMLDWMSLDIPESILNKEAKINVCVKGIDTIISKIREIIRNFNSIELLKNVLLRNETLLSDSAFKQLRAVTYFECFKKYGDAVKEYIEEDSSNVRTSLSIRCLVEFIVAEPYYGQKKINDDDVDFLIALVDELIFLGTTKDLLSFDLDNPEMGKLPSGRLGINKEYFDKINSFSIESKKDEHFEFIENYNSNDIDKDDNQIENEKYYDKIDSVFKDEFGIEMFKLRQLMYELAHFCFENETSYMIFEDEELEQLLKNEFKLTKIEIDSFLNNFILNSRGNISNPPKDYEYQDIFPWRYNRRLSFLSRPILRVKDENEIHRNIISARHLVSSVDNFFALFFNGSLKVNKELKGINSLLAERNNIKGKKFRNEVCDWLSNNTLLEVIPYEFKIPVKGNDKNYGDVDILAFDKRAKIIYSIECKNTKQAKIIYEFQRDAKNYIEKQLPKHRNRTLWLRNNLTFISERFKFDFSEFRVKPYLISSYSLPIKLIKSIEDIEIFSISEVKRKKIF
ncbi:hypothetical protein SY27_12495 [Flavobacterium sp. 316]|uniref:YecA family protein n=1 Tax=Flavobacterium sp. 316 TaxID=1603293 RepID=UPI0005DFC030|nr:SEC-C metal-binding domain-containing protein [Flavobacterium sp. 316]KIX20705.1 hypothetical protein SY27_12495 [Flavobacterium sp. 316]